MTERSSCNHYRKYGHEESNCYELVGYPTNWGTRGRGRGQGRGLRGGKTGGWSRGVTHQMAYVAGNKGTEQSGGENSETPMLPGFTNEQVQRLLSLIESSKPGYEKLLGKSS